MDPAPHPDFRQDSPRDHRREFAGSDNSGASVGGLKILLLEDDPTDRRLLEESLADAKGPKFTLTSAGSLADAGRFLTEQRFDAILMDLTLPESTGLLTFSTIRAHAGEAPIIVLSGLDDESFALEVVRAGAQDYVVKGSMHGQMLWRVVSHAIERNRLTRTVQESEQRYIRLLSSVTDYIYTVQAKDGKVVSTAHGPGCVTVTGYDENDFQRDPFLWYQMVDEVDRAAVVAQADDVFAGRAAALEHRIRHKDGSIRWVRNTPVPRKDGNEKIAGYDGLILDITDRKRAEEALRKAVQDLTQSQEQLKAMELQLIYAEKMESVGKLAAGVAHDVKNPLAILLMSTEFLAAQLVNRDETISSILQDMVDAVHRADAIVRGLLDFAASNTLAVQVTPVDEIIEQSLALVKHELALNRVRVEKQLSDSPLRAAMDRNKMEQVFVNLFTNAIHAMPNGGTLTVRTRTEQTAHAVPNPGSRSAERFHTGDTVLIVEIEDTGTGIPPEAHGRVFDPFFTTKATGKGTGLGLTIVRRIVELHAGTIEIENRPDRGVRALLRLKSA